LDRDISGANAELPVPIEEVSSGNDMTTPSDTGSAAPRRPGSMKGEIQIAGGFDGLPDDVAKAFGANAGAVDTAARPRTK
jgi:hypothetical protein